MKWAVAAFIGVAAAQTAPPAPLSEAARTHLRGDTLAPITHVAELPKLVQEALKANFSNTKLEMADPGQPFQATDVIVDATLPTRRLISAGCSSDHCLIHYEQGGIAHFYRVLVVSVSRTAAKVEWNGMSGGPFPNIAEVQAQVVSGKIKS